MRRVLAGAVVGAALLGGFVAAFDPGAMAAALAGTHLGWLTVGLLAVVLAMVCWSEALRTLLVASGGDASRRRTFLAYGAGVFAKQVVPMGYAGGPAITAYAVDRDVGVGYDRALGVVTVADFFQLLASMLLALVGVSWVVLVLPPAPLLAVLQAGVVLAAVLLGGGAVLLWTRRGTVGVLALGTARLLRRTVGRYSGRVDEALRQDRIQAGVEGYYASVDAVAADRRSLGVAAAYSLIGWVLFVVPLVAATAALGRPVAVGFALFLTPVAGLAGLFPMPGGQGGAELLVAGALVALVGFDPGMAGAAAVLYRLCAYWLMVVVGGACAVASTRSLRRTVDDAPTAVALAAEGVVPGEPGSDGPEDGESTTHGA